MRCAHFPFPPTASAPTERSAQDERLLKAVEQQGHSWANIARTYLPGRTGLAAKNRWVYCLSS